MVSDSDLVTRLREILTASDLDTATAATVRQQLEVEFHVDLSDRKAFVRDQIDIYLQTLQNDLKSNDEDQPHEEDDRGNDEGSDSGIQE